MTIIERIRARHAATVGAASVCLAMSPMDEYRFTSGKSNMPDESRAVVNTAGIDLANEVVVPLGGDWTYFRKYKSVYYGHDYDTLPVGILRNLEFRKNPDRWAMTWAWASNPFAQEVKIAVNEGAVGGTSIGFIPTEKGRPTELEVKAYGECDSVVRKWIGLEVSVTAQPCLPDASIGGKSLDDSAIHGLESLVSKGRISRKSAHLMGLPEVKPQLRKVIILGA